MKKLVCSHIVWLLLCTVTATGQAKWSSIGPGLELADGSLVDKEQSVTFIMIRCDPKKNHVRVIDTFHELRQANSFAAFSVREVRSKTRASIVVNAGSTASYSIPAPVGLLQVGGKIRNK